MSSLLKFLPCFGFKVVVKRNELFRHVYNHRLSLVLLQAIKNGHNQLVVTPLVCGGYHLMLVLVRQLGWQIKYR